MSQDIEFDCDVELEELASACLLSQCQGCDLCQSEEFLKASRRIEELRKDIDDAGKELDFFVCLRKVKCNHHWILNRAREFCKRCGLEGERLAAPEGARKCIRKGCGNQVEPGLCPKHNRPKRACSLDCYRKWQQQSSHVGGGDEQGGEPTSEGQEAQGATGSVQKGVAIR